MEHYQPEFVISYLTNNMTCTCPACQMTTEKEWPLVHVRFNNQLRDSLDICCETVAKQLLLNVQAFEMNYTENEQVAESVMDICLEELNQQCLHLATHHALTTDTALYAIGILLTKAQQDTFVDPKLLATMTEQLGGLAENGVINETYEQLARITTIKSNALKALGSQRISFNLSMMEKMTMALKVSELVVMSDAQLADRVSTLNRIWVHFNAEQSQENVLRNFLIYKLYNDVFPGGDSKHYGAELYQLATQCFQLKMLLSIWLETGNLLTDDILVVLFSSWQRAQKTLPPQTYSSEDDETILLHALSLV
ncbi:hypothetical protein [Enterobacter ludwigii]|uniref:hypothetical protein n=1 Tax=Enterobacter ludwigii TaxID=299767 RepID=UPI003F72BB5C